MTITASQLSIQPVENGYIVVASGYGLQLGYVFPTWAELLRWLADVMLQSERPLPPDPNQGPQPTMAGGIGMGGGVLRP